MPNTNLYNKCKKHFPLTWKKCKYLKKGLINNDSDLYVIDKVVFLLKALMKVTLMLCHKVAFLWARGKKKKGASKSSFDDSSSGEEISMH